MKIVGVFVNGMPLIIPDALAFLGRFKLTTQSKSQILVVYLCMLSVFRPSFEVVKEGRILYLAIIKKSKK
jgi:hypothetical protein